MTRDQVWARRRDGGLLLLFFMVCFQIDNRNLAGAIPSYHVLRYSFLGLIMMGLTWINFRALMRAMRNPLWFPLMLMSFYQFFSALWSQNAFEGFFFGALCLLAFVSAIATGTAMSFGRILDIYVKSALFCTGLGAMFAIAIPSVGIESKFLLSGDWRGLANQKNLFGYFAGIGFVITLLRGIGIFRGIWQRNRLVQLAYALFFLSMVLLSGSRGAQTVMLFTLFVFFVANARIKRYQILAVSVVTLCVSGFVVFSNLEIGVRGITLFGVYIDGSNRFLLWSYGLRDFGQLALTGYGRSGFWTSGRTDMFASENGWVLENFHNGYITLLVEGGILGFGLFLLSFVLIFIALGRVYFSYDGPQAPFAIAMYIGLLVYCFVEAILGRSPQLSVFLVFCLIANVIESARGHRRSMQTSFASQPFVTT